MMAMASGIFTSEATTDGNGNVTYDRAVDEVFLAAYLKGFFTDGVFPYPMDGFQVLAGSGLTLTVNPGKALVQGRFCYDNSAESVTLPTASASFNRYDRVVLRLDLVGRVLGVAVHAGTAATSAVAPALTRNSDVYELCLATVLVSRGATTITQSAITDTRRAASLCGIVTPMTDTIDSEDFEAQLNDAFNTWFEDCQATLSNNVAGNLLNKINANDTAINGRMDTYVQGVSDAESLKRQIICCRMNGDRVTQNTLSPVPFSVAWNSGVLSTGWGYLQNNGCIKISRAGWYHCTFNVYISDSPGLAGTYHVRLYNQTTSLNIAEQYVRTSTINPNNICSGTATALYHLKAGDVIGTYICPPAGNSLYRTNGEHTYLMVAPHQFD